ncbi:39S ribosomal protein L32, mitochondrial isoform X2 [Venturia canescens]|uniref:39S ribosomal protein L32, mitochondrial isoform X2 n=1 Tax=Venturia canescens TaxID=32260 RepID=UPI001C9CFC3C|nr:39S ribosomal protein L32, mitochondrial isoform X2 [Venturia canescens]
MAANIINRLNNAINNIERAIGRILNQGFPPGSIGAFAYDFDGPSNVPKQSHKPATPFSLKDIVGSGFLWAVPKTRRPIEKRLTRKFGLPDDPTKIIKPKTNLIMCPNCGHDYEANTICGHCYARVKAETAELQEKIVETLGLNPVEKEVIVLYENEKEDKDAEFWKTQQIVEIPKKRPAWFHSNLTQSTTQEPSDSKEVKPLELA